MKVRVLGAHNTESRNTRLAGLLVDGLIALDAGSLTSSLSFRDQLRVKHVLLTHPHFDHIRDVPAFAMNLYLRDRSAVVYSIEAARDALATHLMNGRVYPNFFEKPPENPTLRFHPVREGLPVDLEGYKIVPLALPHSVPAVGYEVTSPDESSLFYTGDTGPGLSGTWEKTAPRALFIEITASSRWESFARDSKHMTPGLLEEEMTAFRKLHGYVPRVVALHMSPGLEPEIRRELSEVAGRLGSEVTAGREGMVIDI